MVGYWPFLYSHRHLCSIFVNIIQWYDGTLEVKEVVDTLDTFLQLSRTMGK